jgi:wobble nucleotide-excising tRNase
LSVKFEDVSVIFEEINTLIESFNVRIRENNAVIYDKAKKKTECTALAWGFFAEQVKTEKAVYEEKDSGFDAEIAALEQEIDDDKTDLSNLKVEIGKLNK